MSKIKEIILEPANVKTGSNFKLKIKTTNEIQHKGTNLTFNNSKANQATIRPEGHSEQDTYIGKNLLSSENINKTEARVLYQSQTDGTILANGTKYGVNNVNFTNNTITLETGNYAGKMFLLDGTIELNNVANYDTIFWLVDTQDANNRYNFNSYNSSNVLSIPSGTYYIRIYVGRDNVVFTNAKIGLMLVSGNTIPSTFEKYVGRYSKP